MRIAAEWDRQADHNARKESEGTGPMGARCLDDPAATPSKAQPFRGGA